MCIFFFFFQIIEISILSGLIKCCSSGRFSVILKLKTLIRLGLAGRTGHFVRFVLHWLNFYTGHTEYFINVVENWQAI